MRLIIFIIQSLFYKIDYFYYVITDLYIKNHYNYYILYYLYLQFIYYFDSIKNYSTNMCSLKLHNEIMVSMIIYIFFSM